VCVGAGRKKFARSLSPQQAQLVAPNNIFDMLVPPRLFPETAMGTPWDSSIHVDDEQPGSRHRSTARSPVGVVAENDEGHELSVPAPRVQMLNIILCFWSFTAVCWVQPWQ
jgi:hypothetical protein